MRDSDKVTRTIRHWHVFSRSNSTMTGGGASLFLPSFMWCSSERIARILITSIAFFSSLLLPRSYVGCFTAFSPSPRSSITVQIQQKIDHWQWFSWHFIAKLSISPGDLLFRTSQICCVSNASAKRFLFVFCLSSHSAECPSYLHALPLPLFFAFVIRLPA